MVKLLPPTIRSFPTVTSPLKLAPADAMIRSRALNVPATVNLDPGELVPIPTSPPPPTNTTSPAIRSFNPTYPADNESMRR